MRILCLTALIFLSACASGPKCIQYLECPDGMHDCEQLAHDTCPSGYHVLKDNDVGPDFADFAKGNFPGARSGVLHMVVTCD